MSQQTDTYVVITGADARYALMNAHTGRKVRTYRSREVAIDDAKFLNRHCLPQPCSARSVEGSVRITV
jgi:hypothetical protein